VGLSGNRNRATRQARRLGLSSPLLLRTRQLCPTGKCRPAHCARRWWVRLIPAGSIKLAQPRGL
jgi:hypothetical protein